MTQAVPNTARGLQKFYSARSRIGGETEPLTPPSSPPGENAADGGVGNAGVDFRYEDSPTSPPRRQANQVQVGNDDGSTTHKRFTFFQSLNVVLQHKYARNVAFALVFLTTCLNAVSFAWEDFFRMLSVPLIVADVVYLVEASFAVYNETSCGWKQAVTFFSAIPVSTIFLILRNKNGSLPYPDAAEWTRVSLTAAFSTLFRLIRLFGGVHGARIPFLGGDGRRRTNLRSKEGFFIGMLYFTAIFFWVACADFVVNRDHTCGWVEYHGFQNMTAGMQLRHSVSKNGWDFLMLGGEAPYNKPEECSLDEFQFWRYNGDKALMLFKHYCFAVFFLLAVLGHLPFFRREEGNASDPQNGQSDNTNAIDIGIPANNSTIEIPRIV